MNSSFVWFDLKYISSSRYNTDTFYLALVVYTHILPISDVSILPFNR